MAVYDSRSEDGRDATTVSKFLFRGAPFPPSPTVHKHTRRYIGQAWRGDSARWKIGKIGALRQLENGAVRRSNSTTKFTRNGSIIKSARWDFGRRSLLKACPETDSTQSTDVLLLITCEAILFMVLRNHFKLSGQLIWFRLYFHWTFLFTYIFFPTPNDILLSWCVIMCVQVRARWQKG